MDLDLGGKLALITGGSRGIGRAVGEALAAEGCRLVLVSRRAADLDVEGRYNVSVRTDAADLGDIIKLGGLRGCSRTSTSSSTMPARSPAARCSMSTRRAGARPGT
jgi:NAD(P)-dependent dehydrogenase (short-subunit alcohol dehydrogenase family)